MQISLAVQQLIFDAQWSTAQHFQKMSHFPIADLQIVLQLSQTQTHIHFKLTSCNKLLYLIQTDE